MRKTDSPAEDGGQEIGVDDHAQRGCRQEQH